MRNCAFLVHLISFDAFVSLLYTFVVLGYTWKFAPEAYIHSSYNQSQCLFFVPPGTTTCIIAPTKEADFFFVPHYTSCLINHADTFAGCDTKQLCEPTTELFQQVLSSSRHYRRMDGGAVDVGMAWVEIWCVSFVKCK